MKVVLFQEMVGCVTATYKKLTPKRCLIILWAFTQAGKERLGMAE